MRCDNKNEMTPAERGKGGGNVIGKLGVWQKFKVKERIFQR